MRRSMLFVPGNTPNLLVNADVLGSDSVILDLEDAVAPTEKDAARILVRNTLRYYRYEGCEIVVRINPVETEFWKKDLDEVVPFRPHAIIPTKVGSAADVQIVSGYLSQLERQYGLDQGSVKLIPLIETALGVENAFQIATADPRVIALFLGGEDLTADLHCKRTKEGDEIFYARCRLVNAARAAGIDVYDTPFTDVNDMEGLLRDTQKAKSLGFSGKVSISPHHINTINSVFTPTQAEIDYAHQVMETIRKAKEQGKGVVSLRGKMIDAPIVERARQVLAIEAALWGGTDDE